MPAEDNIVKACKKIAKNKPKNIFEAFAIFMEFCVGDIKSVQFTGEVKRRIKPKKGN